MKIILLGPPGAGKGTHAAIISEKYKVKHFSTGDILRGHIRQQTELGKKAKDIIEKGGLVPDDLVNAMVFDEISKMGKNPSFILDGFPRTIGQADALDQWLKSHGMKIDVALDFETSEKVVVERLSGRRVCPKCSAGYHVHNIPPKKAGICDKCGEALVQRKDDKPETISNRLRTYEKETAPLIDYYKKQKLLVAVPGDKGLEEIQTAVKKLFEELKLIA